MLIIRRKELEVRVTRSSTATLAQASHSATQLECSLGCSEFVFQTAQVYAYRSGGVWTGANVLMESKHLKKDQRDEVKGFEAYFSMEPEQGATPSLNSGRD